MGNMSPVVSQNVQMAKPRAAAAVAQAAALLGNFPFLPHTHTQREAPSHMTNICILTRLRQVSSATFALLSRTSLDFSWFSQFPMLFFSPLCWVLISAASEQAITAL